MLSLPGGILHEDDHVVGGGEPGAHPDTLAHVGVTVLPLLPQVEVGTRGEVGPHMVLTHRPPVQVRDLCYGGLVISTHLAQSYSFYRL